MKTVTPPGAAQPRYARCLEQRVRADQVGANKSIRPGNRTIHVALRCKMHDGVDGVIRHHFGDQGGITDIAFNKVDGTCCFQGLKAVAIAGIGQRIQHHQRILRMLDNPVINKVHADKPCPTRYQQRSRH